RERGVRRKRRVNAVENIGERFAVIQQSGKNVAAKFRASLSLRFVLAAGFHRDLKIRTPEKRIERAGVHANIRLAGRTKTLAAINAQNLPGVARPAALRRIGSRFYGDRRDITGVLMLAVAVGR